MNIYVSVFEGVYKLSNTISILDTILVYMDVRTRTHTRILSSITPPDTHIWTHKSIFSPQSACTLEYGDCNSAEG